MTFFATLALVLTATVTPVATADVERAVSSTDMTITYTVSGSAGLTI